MDIDYLYYSIKNTYRTVINKGYWRRDTQTLILYKVTQYTVTDSRDKWYCVRHEVYCEGSPNRPSMLFWVPQRTSTVQSFW